MQEPNPDAVELVILLQRTQNYPKDQDGIDQLALALEDASRKTHVGMSEIIERCRQESRFCPTDYDLLVVGREIRARQLDKKAEEERREEREEWRRVYGPPQPMPVVTTPANEPWYVKFTKQCIATYGAVPTDIYEYYAAMQEFGFPLTLQILSWYGRDNIAAAASRLRRVDGK